MLIKSIRRAPKKKPCCAGCSQGKVCCGSQPRYEKQGGLWLPERVNRKRRRMTRLELPQWSRDREFLRQVEKAMPLKFVWMKYGDPVKWNRQLQSIKSLLTIPPDQWGGLVRWDLPSYMSVQYEMSCTGCCGVADCCCNDPPPASLFLTVTANGGSCSACNGGDNLVTNESIPSVEICASFPPTGNFLYQNAGDHFCACESLDLECSGANEMVVTLFNPDSSVDLTGTITSCSPFQAVGVEAVAGIDLEFLCGDDGTVGEVFNFIVEE